MWHVIWYIVHVHLLNTAFLFHCSCCCTEGTEPELSDLVCELKEVDWDQLGIHLNVPDHIRRNISRENPSEDRKLSSTLSYWKRNEISPSWETIVKALKKMGNCVRIISRIKSEYITGAHPVQPPVWEEKDEVADRQHPVLARETVAGKHQGNYIC